MEYLNEKRLELLIEADKLEYIPAAASSKSFHVYYSKTHEFWTMSLRKSLTCSSDHTVCVYQLGRDEVLTAIKSTMLVDYHNSPAQKLKRLLDGVD